MAAFGKSARRRHLRLNIENQTSIKLNQDACSGRKWNTHVRRGWAASQLTTSADQCELPGSRIRWTGWPTGVCASSKASSFAELARAVLQTDPAAHLAMVDP